MNRSRKIKSIRMSPGIFTLYYIMWPMTNRSEDGFSPKIYLLIALRVHVLSA